MDPVVVGGVPVHAELLLAANQGQLAMDIAPLPHAHPAQEGLLAQLFELVLGQLLALFLEPVPDVQQSGKVGFFVVERGVRLVCRLLLVLGSLPRVLDAEAGNHNQHFGQAAVVCRGDQHPGQARVQRQAGHGTAEFGNTALVVNRAQLFQQFVAIVHLPAIGCFQKREMPNLAQPGGSHLQNNGRQVGTQNLRIGELRAIQKIGFIVQAKTDTRCHPAAAPCPLVGTGLGDGLDRQALDL